MLTPTSTPAVAGTGNRNSNVNSIVLKSNLFISLPHDRRSGNVHFNGLILFADHCCFFIIFLAGFFVPISMDIFFIFLNCSSVRIVRFSFMAVNISR